jgi:hypothetical protein
VGVQLGPSEKEEWRNQTLCRFPEYEQKLQEGKLPSAKDGAHITEGEKCI